MAQEILLQINDGFGDSRLFIIPGSQGLIKAGKILATEDDLLRVGDTAIIPATCATGYIVNGDEKLLPVQRHQVLAIVREK